MAIQDKDKLKTYFRNGMLPDENNFWDLIDSCYNGSMNGLNFNTEKNSISLGDSSYANGNNSLAFGLNTYANGNNQVVFGTNNVTDSNSVLIIGDGTTSKKSNLFTINKMGDVTTKGDFIGIKNGVEHRLSEKIGLSDLSSDLNDNDPTKALSLSGAYELNKKLSNILGEAVESLSEQKIGSRNYIAMKYLKDWGSGITQSGVAGETDEEYDTYVDVNYQKLYTKFYLNNSFKDIFESKIKYKKDTQYAFKVKWVKLDSFSTYGMRFGFKYVNETPIDWVSTLTNTNEVLIAEGISEKDKTIEGIVASYGSGNNVRIFEIQLTEGNKQNEDWLVAPEDIADSINDVKRETEELNESLTGAFADGIITEAERKRIISSLKELEATLNVIRANYNSFENNELFQNLLKDDDELADTYNDFGSEFTELVSLHSDLVSSINKMIEDDKAEPVEIQNYQTNFDKFSIQLSEFDAHYININKIIETYLDTSIKDAIRKAEEDLEELNNYVDGAFKDGVLTAAERKGFKIHLENLTESFNSFEVEYIDMINHSELAEKGVNSGRNKKYSDYKKELTTKFINFTNKFKDAYECIDTIVQNDTYSSSTINVVSFSEGTVIEKIDYTKINSGISLDESILLNANITTKKSILKSFEGSGLENIIETVLGAYQNEIKTFTQHLNEGRELIEFMLHSFTDELNEYVDGAFKDGVLTEGEKSRIKSFLSEVEEDYNNYVEKYRILTPEEKALVPDNNIANCYKTFTSNFNELYATINTILAMDNSELSGTSIVIAVKSTFRPIVNSFNVGKPGFTNLEQFETIGVPKVLTGSSINEIVDVIISKYENSFILFKEEYDKIIAAVRKQEVINETTEVIETVKSEFNKTFTSEPVPPYKKGDVWVRYNEEKGEGYTYRCEKPKSKYESFDEGDWYKMSTYDNTKTKMEDGLVTSGTLQVAGNSSFVRAGMTGKPIAALHPNDIVDINHEEDKAVRFWAGDEFEQRSIAPFRVLENGECYASRFYGFNPCFLIDDSNIFDYIYGDENCINISLTGPNILWMVDSRSEQFPFVLPSPSANDTGITMSLDDDDTPYSLCEKTKYVGSSVIFYNPFKKGFAFGDEIIPPLSGITVKTLYDKVEFFHNPMPGTVSINYFVRSGGTNGSYGVGMVTGTSYTGVNYSAYVDNRSFNDLVKTTECPCYMRFINILLPISRQEADDFVGSSSAKRNRFIIRKTVGNKPQYFMVRWLCEEFLGKLEFGMDIITAPSISTKPGIYK